MITILSYPDKFNAYDYNEELAAHVHEDTYTLTDDDLAHIRLTFNTFTRLTAFYTITNYLVSKHDMTEDDANGIAWILWRDNLARNDAIKASQ